MRKEKNTQYFLYHIQNKINNKLYVGITIDCTKRWRRHILQAQHKVKHAIHCAILKYGPNNFIFKEIEKCDSWDHACERERFWIKSLKEAGNQLYNETDGGEGSFGVRRYGADNPNFGKEMKPHVKQGLLKTRRKLTDVQISEIRALYATNNHTQTQLAGQFNVSLTQIHRIVKGKSWGDKAHDEIITKKNLTLQNVQNIRQMYSTGNYTQKELAQQFNCSLTHMNKIINGKKWGASLSNNQAADQ
jgi:group I intron endonuclease